MDNFTKKIKELGGKLFDVSDNIKTLPPDSDIMKAIRFAYIQYYLLYCELKEELKEKLKEALKTCDLFELSDLHDKYYGYFDDDKENNFKRYYLTNWTLDYGEKIAQETGIPIVYCYDMHKRWGTCDEYDDNYKVLLCLPSEEVCNKKNPYGNFKYGEIKPFKGTDREYEYPVMVNTLWFNEDFKYLPFINTLKLIENYEYDHLTELTETNEDDNVIKIHNIEDEDIWFEGLMSITINNFYYNSNITHRKRTFTKICKTDYRNVDFLKREFLRGKYYTFYYGKGSNAEEFIAFIYKGKLYASKVYYLTKDSSLFKDEEKYIPSFLDDEENQTDEIKNKMINLQI